MTKIFFAGKTEPMKIFFFIEWQLIFDLLQILLFLVLFYYFCSVYICHLKANTGGERERERLLNNLCFTYIILKFVLVANLIRKTDIRKTLKNK